MSDQPINELRGIPIRTIQSSAGDFPAVVAGTGEPPRQEARTLSASGEPLKWCSHVGGLGPPFPFCAICEAETATPEPPQARQPRDCELCRNDGVQRPASVCEWHYQRSAQREADAEAALLALREGLEQLIWQWQSDEREANDMADHADTSERSSYARGREHGTDKCADELQSLVERTRHE